MKSLVIAFVFLAGFSFAQDKVFEAKVINPSSFNESKTAGEFKFQFPKNTDKALIEKNAAYYTKFFTVALDEKKSIVTIKMIQNDENGRHIIVRFLMSTKISQIEMDGTLYKVDEFYKTKLK